jgi:hypothetical protein
VGAGGGGGGGGGRVVRGGLERRVAAVPASYRGEEGMAWVKEEEGTSRVKGA